MDNKTGFSMQDRIPLEEGSAIHYSKRLADNKQQTAMNEPYFRVGKVYAVGGSCIVYEGKKIQFSNDEENPTLEQNVLIKECYPTSDKCLLHREGDLIVISPELSPERSKQEESKLSRLKKQFRSAYVHAVEYYSKNNIKDGSEWLEDNGTYYMISPAGRGLNLSNIDREKLTLENISAIMMSLCKKIGFFHERLWLYLDCKPENIFCEGENLTEVSLFDFNSIAPNKRAGNWNISASPGWEAPEQIIIDECRYAEPKNINFKTDIFSIGAVFFWLLCGAGKRQLQYKRDKRDELDSICNGTFNWEGESELYERAGEDARKKINEILRNSVAFDNADRKYENAMEMRGDFIKLWGFSEGADKNHKSIYEAVNDVQEKIEENGHVLIETVGQTADQLSTTISEGNEEIKIWIKEYFTQAINDLGAESKENTDNFYDEKLFEDGTLVQEVRKGFFLIRYPKGGIYEGEVKNGIRQGRGKVLGSNGYFYEGEWKDGERNGYGVERQPNGDRYEGHFLNGKYSGHGTYYYNNGDKFEGEYKNHAQNGHGRYSWANGKVFEGEYLNGTKEGYGKLTWQDGSYEGYWKNGLRNGRGVQKIPAGRYEGYFLDGKFQGEGTYYYKNGERYEGEWVNDKAEGYGKFWYVTGGTYEGEWKDGQKNGHGIDRMPNGNWYEGEYLDGKYNGKGSFYFSNGEKYEGEWKDGQYEGYGKFWYLTGGTYEGEWKGGKKNGQGTDLMPNGDKYEGEYLNGQKNGKGTYYFAAGGTYEGEWKNGRKNGFGKELMPAGGRYEGDYLNGKRSGRGTYYYADGRKYDGEWKDGKREGQGTLEWPDGDRYEGEYLNDNRNGHGTHYYADGRKYEGGWKDGKKEGHGKFEWTNGKTYEGEWKNDKRIGKGIMHFSSGNRYEGEFLNGQYNGRGTYYYANGQKYEGEWKDDKREGQGTYEWPSGDRYVGDWKGGRKEGKGVFYYANGNMYEGEYLNGNCSGRGTFYCADGRKYIGEWINGKKEGNGRFEWPNGEWYEGGWKDDKREGQGTFLYKNGSYYKGSFKKGKRSGDGTLYSLSGNIIQKGAWADDKFIAPVISGQVIAEPKKSTPDVAVKKDFAGWPDNCGKKRKIYSSFDLPTIGVLNSVIDNPKWGDERYFIHVWNENNTLVSSGAEIVLNPGSTYRVHILLCNDANTKAYNMTSVKSVRASVYYPSRIGKGARDNIEVSITSSLQPSGIICKIPLKANNELGLDTKDPAVIICTGTANGTELADDLFTNKGTEISYYKDIKGVIPAGFERSVVIEFSIKVWTNVYPH